jgi:hypothetical protein
MSGSLDLESKCEQAVIAWLKSSPQLAGKTIQPGADEAAKTNGAIYVHAKRGQEITPPSGVYAVAVSIEFMLRIRTRGQSQADFNAIRAAIAERCEIHWKILADNLTKAARQDFHCYDARIQDTDPTPSDGQHHYILVLQLDAMPVTFGQADKLKPNPPAEISFFT